MPDAPPGPGRQAQAQVQVSWSWFTWIMHTWLPGQFGMHDALSYLIARL